MIRTSAAAYGTGNAHERRVLASAYDATKTWLVICGSTTTSDVAYRVPNAVSVALAGTKRFN